MMCIIRNSNIERTTEGGSKDASVSDDRWVLARKLTGTFNSLQIIGIPIILLKRIMNIFEDISKSPIGRSLLSEPVNSTLSFLTPDHVFDPSFVLFPEPHLTELETNDQIAALKLAQLAMLSSQAYSTWFDLIEVFKMCESPIEQYFLAAMIYIVKDRYMNVVVVGESVYLEKASFSCFYIYPQKQIGDFRVDFLLSMYEIQSTPQDNPYHKETVKIREDLKLVVECDGHDFHEKTKKQASRDKERDRTLQTCGFPVFRYSGSDIYKNAIKCAIECMDYLMGIK